jgi:2-polyprenyl-6-methoxyphenol hydroxylase-like FAD-dependent oxidoreductase
MPQASRLGPDGPAVAVFGGSIGGLISALVLRDAGCDVQVFERSRIRLEGRGAEIVLHPVTVRYLEATRSLDLERVAAPASVLRYLTRDGQVLLERSGTGWAGRALATDPNRSEGMPGALIGATALDAGRPGLAFGALSVLCGVSWLAVLAGRARAE